ncbi:hypothetical protein H4R20_001847 [Coemansia guatemalensis]|uniref:Uncharacterized protein n=1 Tax=Coemansia guatemalensis TaxID=2761395 RepID=A0A9W8HYE7_9FUNG|nr:hypothetical protein H4R20_001847 [Coemansia guatemalensis]
MSPAIKRMVQRIERVQEPVDIKADIESFRFSSTDLLKDLPKHYSQGMGDAAALSTADDLASISKEKAVEVLRQIRRQRARQISTAFTQEQLRRYLEMNGQKMTGNKGVLTERIINKVWGIRVDVLEERLAREEKKADNSGMTMPLSEEVRKQLETVESGFWKQLESEFGVVIEPNLPEKMIRVSGKMHSVRATLSSIRERLAADATVVVDLKKYGKLRPLTPKHTNVLSARIQKSFGTDGTIVHFNGEFFARGTTRADSLDVQQALVDALIEPVHSTLFVGAPNHSSAFARTTLVPTVDLISKPRTFVPELQFFALPNADSESQADLESGHAVYRREPMGQFEHRYDASIAQELREWALRYVQGPEKLNSLSFRLGKVMLDLDRGHDVLFNRFHTPQELLERIGARAPLVEFSDHVSPLQWLHSQSNPDESPKQLIITLCALPPQSSEPPTPKAHYMLPVYGDEKLIVRIEVRAGALKLETMQIECVRNQRRADVVILQSAHDLQANVFHQEAVEATDALVGVLKELVGRVGSTGGSNQQGVLRRHEVVEMPTGRFGVVGVELDGVTRRQLENGLLIRIRQIWNILDDQRHSSVELLPSLGTAGTQNLEALLLDSAEWDRAVQHLLEAAAESAAPVSR